MNEQVVYGLHAVEAVLRSQHRNTHHLYVNEERDDNRLQTILTLARDKGVVIESLPFKKLNQRFAGITHQGVVAMATPLREYTEKDLPTLLEGCKKPITILILDGVTDPHNLGACIRSADAAGVDFVIIPKDKSANLSAISIKVASGAAEHIPLVRVTNLVRSIETIKEAGIWVYGAALEATKNIYSLPLNSSVALVLGAEGQGLRRLTREHCDDLFILPMLGSVDSLNVSVATGISLYEVVRQRL